MDTAELYSDGPGPELVIRQVTNEDIEWLLDLRMATMAEHYKRSGQDLSREEQCDRLVHAYSSISIIQRDGLDIGMMKVVRHPDVWDLVQIQLLPECQGSGLGAILVRNLVDAAQQAGVPVRLYVLKVNPAMRLYERLGFTVTKDSGHSWEMRTRVREDDAVNVTSEIDV